MEHETLGNSSAAYECYQKAVDISPLVAFELIQVGYFFLVTSRSNITELLAHAMR